MKPRGLSRAGTILLCVVLLCAASVSALAETAVVNNPDPTDRLNLRSEAKSGADILRKYHSGVTVEILSDAGNGWAKVRIGSAEGYMQKQFLVTGANASSMQSAIPVGEVDVTPPQTKLALRERESDDAAAVGSYDQGTSVEVLGISDGWLHVRVMQDGRTGFMRSAWVTMIENLKTAAVSVDKATLRQAPQSDGKSLGTYAQGVPMVILFSFEKLEGWSRVRIGDTVGFMRSSDLVYGPEPNTFSPATKAVSNPGSFANLRKAATSDSLVIEKLGDGASVSVLGTAGDWTHVQTAAGYGYIQTKFLK